MLYWVCDSLSMVGLMLIHASKRGPRSSATKVLPLQDNTLNENVWISITISLKFILKGPNNNIPALVQIMAWCWSVNKPLSEPMMVKLPTYMYVTRPQWVNWVFVFHGDEYQLPVPCCCQKMEKKIKYIIMLHKMTSALQRFITCLWQNNLWWKWA